MPQTLAYASFLLKQRLNHYSSFLESTEGVQKFQQQEILPTTNKESSDGLGEVETSLTPPHT